MHIFSIVSGIFHNNRRLQVWLPPGYDDPANATKKDSVPESSMVRASTPAPPTSTPPRNPCRPDATELITSGRRQGCRAAKAQPGLQGLSELLRTGLRAPPTKLERWCFALRVRQIAQGILSVTPTRTVATIAGTGAVGYGGDGGAATSATLASPSAVAYDASGNLYLADAQNHVVREISLRLAALAARRRSPWPRVRIARKTSPFCQPPRAQPPARSSSVARGVVPQSILLSGTAVQTGTTVTLTVASIAKWRKSFSDIWRDPLAAGIM